MKKLISLLLCLTLALAFTACGNKTPGKDSSGSGETTKNTLLSREEADAQGLLKGELIIKTMNKGYGTDFLKKMAVAYTENVNSDATVSVKAEADVSSTVGNELSLGAKGNHTDMYFGAGYNFAVDYMDALGGSFGSESMVLDLTDFLDTWETFDGEVMRDAVDAGLVSMLSIPDKNDAKVSRTFALPWAGSACGLIYNTEIFEEVGVTVPQTTDELFAVCDKILAYNEKNAAKQGFKPIMPIIYPGQNAIAYWEYLTYSWWAQYEGYDRFMQYWTLTDDDPFFANQELYKQRGQLEAIKVSEKLIKGKYTYEPSKGSADDVVEKAFFNGTKDYRFAMTPNGDWFENEITGRVFNGSSATDNFAMMKTPKLSAAVEKNGGIGNVQDFAFTLASTHNIIIPVYSPQRYLALDFLTFYYSEVGAEIFYEETKSLLPRADYSYLKGSKLDKMSKFTRSLVEIVDSTEFVFQGSFLSPVRYFGGMPTTPEGMGSLEKEMLDGKTAKEAWNSYIAYFDKNWDTYCTEAGVEY